MIMLFLRQYWKQAAIIALGLIIFSFGWYKGYSGEKAEFDAFKLQIEVNGKLQEEKNANLLKSQEKISQDVTKGYSDAIKKLNSYYSTHRVYNSTTSSSVPNTTETSNTADGETESNLSSTIRDCSLDVVQLLYLQKWIKEQELINGN